jgi:hypothetical protein
MTIYGMTKEVTFNGIATFAHDSTVVGPREDELRLRYVWADQAHAGALMSVDDKIDLEIVFDFKRN